VFVKIKSPAWRATFWALVVIGPPYMLWTWAGIRGSSLIVEHHPAITLMIEVYFSAALMPGIILEIIRGLAFSPYGIRGAIDWSPVVPLGSWFFWSTALFLIFRWRQRRAARRTPQTIHT
jgi:hypothetical protein